MRTAVFDDRIHGFWHQSCHGSQNKSKSTQARSSSGPRLKASVWVSGSSFVSGSPIPSPPHGRPAADLQTPRPFSQLCVRFQPPNPSPAKPPPPSAGLKVPARWAAPLETAEVRGRRRAAHGCGKRSRFYFCAAARCTHSHPRGERARRGAAGRGREGSESWPESPLTQCLEAPEGRQQQAARGCPSLSSWERNTRICRERPVSPSPRTHQDNCPRDEARSTTLSLPRSQGAGP